MKTNQNQARAKNSPAAKSKQARKSCGDTPPATNGRAHLHALAEHAPASGAAEPTTEIELARECYRIRNRNLQLHGGSLAIGHQSDEDMLDYVCTVLREHGRELLGKLSLEASNEDLLETLVIANAVANRAEKEAGREWEPAGERLDRRARLRIELPGYAGTREWGDMELFNQVACNMDNRRVEIMERVLPRVMMPGAAAPLAEALVICEQQCTRNGYSTDLDENLSEYEYQKTPVRAAAEHYRSKELAETLGWKGGVR